MKTIDEIVTAITFANWGTGNSSGKGKVLKEYIDQIVELCAEEACSTRDSAYNDIVDKQSILDVKNQIF